MISLAVTEFRELQACGEVRRLRKAAGIRAATMAAGLGVTQGVVSKIERAELTPGRVLAARYLRVLRGLAEHEEAWQREAAQAAARGRQ